MILGVGSRAEYEVENTRHTPRYPFTAPAELIVEGSNGKRLARVKELSLHGCYLDSLTSLPLKSVVVVKIYGVHDYFEARATVIYGNPNLGLGLVFREVKPPCVEVLQKWL